MRRFLVGAALAAAVALVPRLATAQGYGVYEHGTCMMGRAGTGVADPCTDGSAIFFNPAGLAAPGLETRGRQTATGGVTFIMPRGGFVDGTTGERMDLKPKTHPVPHLFLTTGIGSHFAAGLGVFAPYGLARLRHGLSYRGRALPPCQVSWQNEVRLRFALKGVQPGQLRDVCRQVGLEVVAIRRLRIGRVSLAKMPVGAWRYLPVGERF